MALRRSGIGSWAFRLVCALAAALWLASSAVAGRQSPSPSTAGAAGSFDAPVRKVTVDLGRDPDYPSDNVHDILSCYYYPQLLVKELDIKGDVGSAWLSILHSRDSLPACERAHAPGERVIEYPEWNGNFWGVKSGLVFFSCPEFEQGACSFAVYASTSGKQIFTGDVAVSDKDRDVHMQVFSTKAGVVARYVAAAHAGCDLYQGADCWNKVKAKFGLKGDRKPVCEGYPQVYKEFRSDQDESMIGYPVQVTLSSRPSVRSVAGPVRCWSTY